MELEYDIGVIKSNSYLYKKTEVMFHLKPNYVTDEDNNKVAVQLNIKTYEKIEEVLENYSLYKLMVEDSSDMSLNVAEAKAYYKKLKKKR